MLAGDPVIQAIINEECAAQGRGLLEAAGLTGHPTAPAVVTCIGALRGAPRSIPLRPPGTRANRGEGRALSRSPAALSLRSHRRIGGRSRQKVV